MTPQSARVPELCSTCHRALETHFDEVLATLSAAAPMTWEASRQIVMVKQLVLLVKHHILDGDLAGNERFLEALRALETNKR